MTDTEQAARDQPEWVKALGCLCALVVVTLLVLFALASCAPAPNANGRVTVVDTADLLSPAIESVLMEIGFPEDTPVIVKTVESIPIERIGAFATILMENDPEWQTLRPRGFLRRYFRHDLPSGSGLYVLASRTPRLIQIRFGHENRLAAYQAGIAAGTWYRAQQEFSSEQRLLATVRELSAMMANVVDPWWPLSWAQYLASTVASDVEDFLAPSDGLYSTSVLTGYIRLADLVGGTGSPGAFVTFNVLCFIVLWLVGKKLIIQALLLPRVEAGWVKAVLLIASNLGLLGALVTGFSALALLSKGRLEDELALSALGLSFISTAGFSPILFSTHGGFLLAIPGMIVSFVAEVLEAAAESEEARRSGKQVGSLTFAWLAWGCALYLLPMAVAIPSFIVLLWNAGSTVVASMSRHLEST